MGQKSISSVTTTRNLRDKMALLASFAIPAVFVVGFLFLLISLRNGAEAAMGGLANFLPVSYAFAAGMVASVNPCGFFMLPSYLSYHLGTEESGFYESPALVRLLRALLLGGTATIGFVVVFAAVGAIVATGGYWLVKVFPYAGVAIGAAMIGLGLWLLVTHRAIGIMAASRVSITPRRNLRNVFLFGIGYAVCSLSCTLPVFLVVVGSAMASRGFFASFGQFIGYALGMGAIVVAVTVGAAMFRGVVAQWLRKAIPYMHRMSALFLVGAGAYLVYYWVFYADFFF
jgi:cytochrome c biogenesis protein CcdA